MVVGQTSTMDSDQVSCIMRLPPELLDRILSHLRDTRLNDIKNFSLVCRLWRSLSLRHLFSEILIHIDQEPTANIDELSKLVDLLDDDTSVFSHARGLFMTAPFYPKNEEPKLNLSLLEAAVRKLGQLEVLRINMPHIVLDNTERHVNSSRDMWSVNRPRLRRLCLANMAGPEYSPHILRIFQEIERLELRFDWEFQKRDPPPKHNISELTRIYTLYIEGCESTMVIQTLDSLPMEPTALQSLQILSPMDPSDVPALNAFLTTHAKHLKAFRYTDSGEPHFNEPWDYVDLSICTEIDCIHLTSDLPVFYLSHTDHWNRYIATVKSAPRSLKQVFIDINVLAEDGGEETSASPEDLLSTVGGLDWMEMGRAAAHAQILRVSFTNDGYALEKPDSESVQKMIYSKLTADMRRIIQFG